MVDVVDGAIDERMRNERMKKLPWPSASLLLVIATALIVAAGFAIVRTLSASTVDTSAENFPATSALPGQMTAAPSSAVGALFTRQNGQLGQHFCTASVVASQAGNLVITAAHCVTGVSLSPAGDVVFAPSYSDGRFPHGLWAVTRKFVDAEWSSRQDPDDDVAFLEVTPLRGRQVPASEAAPAVSLQQATGAERLRFDAPLPAQIDAIGYPDGTAQAVSCPTQAREYRPEALDQVMFYCPGFTDGTSGGPFLSDFRKATGIGAIIGVIGGYQQGGDSPSISYSSAFTTAIKSLYQHVLKLR
jgi:V8-like Glu-specific endopeptidase